MHMLVEVVHLEAVKLRRYLLNILLLVRLLRLDTLGVPAAVSAREDPGPWLKQPTI